MTIHILIFAATLLIGGFIATQARKNRRDQ